MTLRAPNKEVTLPYPSVKEDLLEDGTYAIRQNKFCAFQSFRLFRTVATRTIGATPNQHGDRAMKSSVVKRSTVVAGHRTSVSLEDAFWNAMKVIALERQMSVSGLLSEIDTNRQQGNLSSAIRLFVLDFYRDQIFEHEKRSGTRELSSSSIPLALKQGP